MKRAFFLVLVAGACTPQNAVPADTPADTAGVIEQTKAEPPTATDTTIRGRPAVSGGTATVPSKLRGKLMASGTDGSPFTVLQTTAGSFVLTGALEPELRVLSGATAEVSGVQSSYDARKEINVESYDVVDINGERPYVGYIADGNRLVVDRDTLTLTGTITAPVGAKVWVTGDRSGKAVAVRSFGIIAR